MLWEGSDCLEEREGGGCGGEGGAGGWEGGGVWGSGRHQED